MRASDIHHVGALRSSTRTFTVLALAVAMFATMVFVPADAREGDGDDLESVRATVTAKYNQKIGILTERMAGTEDPDKQSIYAAAIAELTRLRDTSVATEDNIDALWALKDRAYAIYNEAISAAMSDEEVLAAARKKAADAISYKTELLTAWTKECRDPDARTIAERGIAQLSALYPEAESAATPDAAYAVKDRAYAIYHETIDMAEEAAAVGNCDGLTEEEKAAKELKNALWSTLSLIERKTAILTAAAEAADNARVGAIFAEAAEEVAGLEGPARSAGTIGALKEIEGTVMDIYHAARDAVASLRGEADKEDHDKDPARTLEVYLGKVAARVDHLTDLASETADESPGTYEAVVEANENVHKAINAVLEVAESGKNLDSRREDLSRALKTFKRAFVAHYVALANGPISFGKLHIPG